MQSTKKILLFLAAAALFHGCSFGPLTYTAAPAEEMQRVQDSINRWPEVSPELPGLKRPFFANLSLAGRRIPASGVLDYHNPRDFRLTTTTDAGAILFDARFNWAGVTFLRLSPGIDPRTLDMLMRDLSKSLDLPDSLVNLGQSRSDLVLRKKAADLHRYTWIFNPATGNLRELYVDLGPFDDLRTQYLSYNAFGWPEELTLSRKTHDYSISFSFTDDHVASAPATPPASANPQ